MKREPEKKLSDFNYRSYAKNEFIKKSEEAEEEQPNEGKPSKIKNPEDAKSKRNKIKSLTQQISSNDDAKIPFMNYLPVSLHEKFGYLHLQAKSTLRERTRKALSQTELVEAILEYAVENWETESDRILKIAEIIIGNRKSKD